MNIEIKERFMAAWKKYFPCSELPIVCFYSNELGDVKFPDHPKAVLGSMDPSARIYFKPNIVTFAVPWPKFLSMFKNMDESFLDTAGWTKVKSRSQRVK